MFLGLGGTRFGVIPGQCFDVVLEEEGVFGVNPGQLFDDLGGQRLWR